MPVSATRRARTEVAAAGQIDTQSAAAMAMMAYTELRDPTTYRRAPPLLVRCATAVFSDRSVLGAGEYPVRRLTNCASTRPTTTPRSI
jgi:hypothetical protein